MSMIVRTDDGVPVRIIEYAHEAVHRDDFVVASDYDSDIDITPPKRYLHTAPTGRNAFDSHVVFKVDTAAAAIVRIYRDPTITANGTAITHTRLNQYSDKDITTTYADPTLSNVGTLVWVGFVPGGTGGNAVGGSTRSGEEYVLPSGSSLVVEITSVADNNKGSFAAEYYEGRAGLFEV